MNIDYVTYPDWFCNYPCRGNAVEKCGGITTRPTSKEKRQLPVETNDEEVVLLTVYNTTFDGDEIDENDGTGTMTSSSTLASITPTLGPFPSSIQSSPNLSPTDIHPVIISTSYTTICPSHPILCPTPTPTLLSTTITVLHCGCTAQGQQPQKPTVPMTMITTMIPCQGSCGSHRQGAAATASSSSSSLITLTVPHTSEIAILESSVRAWMSAPTSKVPVATTIPVEISPIKSEAGSRSDDQHPPMTMAIMTITLVPVPVQGSVNDTMGRNETTTTTTMYRYHESNHDIDISVPASSTSLIMPTGPPPPPPPPPPASHVRPAALPLQSMYPSGASRSISSSSWGWIWRMKHAGTSDVGIAVTTIAIVVYCLIVPLVLV